VCTASPVDVRLLGPAAVMPRPNGKPHAIEELQIRARA
jgi:hypothetical protein